MRLAMMGFGGNTHGACYETESSRQRNREFCISDYSYRTIWPTRFHVLIDIEAGPQAGVLTKCQIR